MTPSFDAESGRVRRLVGVYHASGTLFGELSYWIGARLGRTHCPLCDITHGSVREKPAWRACRDQLAVPFDTVHLDDRPPDLRVVSEGQTPCVVADTGDGLLVLLGRADLTACNGSPEALVDAVERAAARRGLLLRPGP